jgi:hypothetical protein
MSFPDFVQDRIDKIRERTKISVEEIQKDYGEIFNDDFIQKDPQFASDEERHRYAVMVLWTRYVARPPVKEFTVVPVGFSGMRLARGSGQPSCTLYVLVKGEKKIKRIACRGTHSDLYKSINLFNQYTVKLGEFSKGGDLLADDRTNFENPVRLNLKPSEMMQRIGVKQISIEDAAKFPSAQRKGQRKGSSFIDASDWRCVRGIIVRDFRGVREDETEYGCYTIADGTLNGEPVVADDGSIIRPGFTVWTDPSHMVYGAEDEVDCFGTVGVNKEGEATMNAYLILPVHMRGGK